MRSVLLCTLLLPLLAQAQYKLVKEYIGDRFFDDWNFYNNIDNLTHGDVFYEGFKQASQSKLAFVNDAGNAVMKVDNTTKINFGQKRNSIRIVSKAQYTVGSVWVADFVHMPYGCSVWPGWWTSATNWPQGGEIDTLEGVNADPLGHSALHTSPGCMHSNTSTQTSTLVNSTDCSIYANSNEGCTITNPSTLSYGADFANNGGGVFVTEFAVKGISIWFFPRSSIPSSLQGNASTIDTSTLGTPMANWASDGCQITQFFEPQQLIFDISLCGDYAGNPTTFAQTCSGVCYDDWVVGDDPSVYSTAYFEVGYVRAYGTPGELTIIQSGAARTGRPGGAALAAVAGLVTLLVAGVLAL